MRVLSIINQKGGCGKTTTAINLSAIAARHGKKVLLIDLDPQSHCAIGLAVPENRIERHIGDLLLRDPSRRPVLAEWTWQVSQNLDLIPSSMHLAALEAPGRGLNQLHDRDRRLEWLLSWVHADYDWCVVDCPPSIGLLTFNALRASSNVIIPVETGFFALQGAERQVQTIRTLNQRLARDVPFALLPTMFDDRVRLSREILQHLRTRFTDVVVPRPVRYCIRLREAAGLGQPVVEYAPDAESAMDYEALYAWIDSHLSQEALPSPAANLGRAPVASVYGGMTRNHEQDLSALPRAAPDGCRDYTSTPARSSFDESGQTTPAWTLRESMIDTDRGAGAERPGARAAELAARARAISSRRDQTQQAGRAARRMRSDSAPSIHSDSTSGFESKTDSSAVEQNSNRVGDGIHRVASTARHLGDGAVQFTYMISGERPQQVFVAGTFNGWSSMAHPMNYDPAQGLFEIQLQIPAGMHRYRFIVDLGAHRTETTPTSELNVPASSSVTSEILPDVRIRQRDRDRPAYTTPVATSASSPGPTK